MCGPADVKNHGPVVQEYRQAVNVIPNNFMIHDTAHRSSAIPRADPLGHLTSATRMVHTGKPGPIRTLCHSLLRSIQMRLTYRKTLNPCRIVLRC